jgi:hypothetical protein
MRWLVLCAGLLVACGDDSGPQPIVEADAGVEEEQPPENCAITCDFETDQVLCENPTTGTRCRYKWPTTEYAEARGSQARCTCEGGQAVCTGAARPEPDSITQTIPFAALYCDYR